MSVETKLIIAACLVLGLTFAATEVVAWYNLMSDASIWESCMGNC